MDLMFRSLAKCIANEHGPMGRNDPLAGLAQWQPQVRFVGSWCQRWSECARVVAIEPGLLRSWDDPPLQQPVIGNGPLIIGENKSKLGANINKQLLPML